ncbi:MAG: hypothetical protein LBH73_07975, partial [Spirochaetaceae bacterium]|jgi:hypothetical protein|nr:hypothetical protein [Spirochaetaceae bacterium]
MKETAAAYPDGETALYEYISGLLLKPSETVLEGSRTDEESKKVKTYGKAPEGPPQGRETHCRGFERMAEYAKGRTA